MILDGVRVAFGWILDLDMLDGFWVHSWGGLGSDSVVKRSAVGGSGLAGWLLGGHWVGPVVRMYVFANVCYNSGWI